MATGFLKGEKVFIGNSHSEAVYQAGKAGRYPEGSPTTI